MRPVGPPVHHLKMYSRWVRPAETNVCKETKGEYLVSAVSVNLIFTLLAQYVLIMKANVVGRGDHIQLIAN